MLATLSYFKITKNINHVVALSLAKRQELNKDKHQKTNIQVIQYSIHVPRMQKKKSKYQGTLCAKCIEHKYATDNTYKGQNVDKMCLK